MRLVGGGGAFAAFSFSSLVSCDLWFGLFSVVARSAVITLMHGSACSVWKSLYYFKWFRGMVCLPGSTESKPLEVSSSSISEALSIETSKEMPKSNKETDDVKQTKKSRRTSKALVPICYTEKVTLKHWSGPAGLGFRTLTEDVRGAGQSEGGGDG